MRVNGLVADTDICSNHDESFSNLQEMKWKVISLQRRSANKNSSLSENRHVIKDNLFDEPVLV